jgi:hypothetical protein
MRPFWQTAREGWLAKSEVEFMPSLAIKRQPGV